MIFYESVDVMVTKLNLQVFFYDWCTETSARTAMVDPGWWMVGGGRMEGWLNN